MAAADARLSTEMAPVLQSVSPSLRGMMSKSPQRGSPNLNSPQLEYMQMPNWDILMLPTDQDQQEQPQIMLPHPRQDAMMLPPPMPQSTPTAATRTVPKLVFDVRTITVRAQFQVGDSRRIAVRSALQSESVDWQTVAPYAH